VGTIARTKMSTQIHTAVNSMLSHLNKPKCNSWYSPHAPSNSRLLSKASGHTIVRKVIDIAAMSSGADHQGNADRDTSSSRITPPALEDPQLCESLEQSGPQSGSLFVEYLGKYWPAVRPRLLSVKHPVHKRENICQNQSRQDERGSNDESSEDWDAATITNTAPVPRAFTGLGRVSKSLARLRRRCGEGSDHLRSILRLHTIHQH
jgi:hypothetical protein